MVPIKSLYFVSGSKRLKPGENYSGLYGKFLSSNGPFSAYFDNIHLKLSTNVYCDGRFQSMLPKNRSSKYQMQK